MDQKEWRKEKWRSIAQRLRANLEALGLLFERDFWIFGELDRHHYSFLALRERRLITVELLVACDAARERQDWGILVSLPNPGADKLATMVEVSGGGFSLGQDVSLRDMILEAHAKVRLGWPRGIPPTNLPDDNSFS